MSNLGGGEMLAIFLLALIVLGPERLPVVARKLGGFVRKARAMSAGIEQEVRKAIDLDPPQTPKSPASPRIRAVPALDAVDGLTDDEASVIDASPSQPERAAS